MLCCRLKIFPKHDTNTNIMTDLCLFISHTQTWTCTVMWEVISSALGWHWVCPKMHKHTHIILWGFTHISAIHIRQQSRRLCYLIFHSYIISRPCNIYVTGANTPCALYNKLNQDREKRKGEISNYFLLYIYIYIYSIYIAYLSHLNDSDNQTNLYITLW